METEKLKKKTLRLIERESIYVGSCVDKIYDYFQKYGYVWFDTDNLPPSRSRIEQTITNLLDSAIHRTEDSTGRITVQFDKETDSFKVLLDL